MDFALKLAGLAAFVAYLGLIGFRVPTPDLIVVLILVAAMAIYDFFIRPWLIMRR